MFRHNSFMHRNRSSVIGILFYIAAACLAVALLASYRFLSKENAGAVIQSIPGNAFIASLVGLAITAMWLILLFRHGDLQDRRNLIMVCGVNALAVTLAIGTTEVAIRLLATQTTSGIQFRRVLLYPHSWSETVARHTKVLDRLAVTPTYLMYDSMIGWTLTPDRADSMMMYINSVEGLRAPSPHLAFSEQQVRMSGSAGEGAYSSQVALIGDSMTFGHEIRCEQTWGHLLEQHLGPDRRVLNFAVPGYSLAQVWLRYQRDVRPWHPKVVVLGLDSEMIRRNMSIYNFLLYPHAVDFPFARSRFVRQQGGLVHVNQPVMAPPDIFSKQRVTDLPYLDLDRYYAPVQWEHGGAWTLIEWSYLFRLLNSVRPPSEEPWGARSDGVMADLGVAILQLLAREVAADGATLLVVHLPYEPEIAPAALPGTTDPLDTQVLRDAGIEFHQMADCLVKHGGEHDFEPGGHYGPAANAAIAQCLAEIFKELPSPKRLNGRTR